MSAREKLLRSLAPEVVLAVEELVVERVSEAIAAATNTHGARWLTLEQAADRLGCSADAVRMRVKRGRLEARRHGRRVYVSRASVDQLA
jgi:excisionase family DNA binding protein